MNDRLDGVNTSCQHVVASNIRSPGPPLLLHPVHSGRRTGAFSFHLPMESRWSSPCARQLISLEYPVQTPLVDNGSLRCDCVFPIPAQRQEYLPLMNRKRRTVWILPFLAMLVGIFRKCPLVHCTERFPDFGNNLHVCIAEFIEVAAVKVPSLYRYAVVLTTGHPLIPLVTLVSVD